MIPLLTTSLSQVFRPITGIRQKINLTGQRELKLSKHLFYNGHFGLKPSTSFSAFRMIEFSPKGKEEVFIKRGRKGCKKCQLPSPSGEVGLKDDGRRLDIRWVAQRMLLTVIAISK